MATADDSIRTGEDPTKAVLSESGLNKKHLCDYVVNVATGCKHGCKFCYVPSTPAIRTRPDMLKEHADVDSPQKEWGNYVLYRDDIIDRIGIRDTPRAAFTNWNVNALRWCRDVVAVPEHDDERSLAGERSDGLAFDTLRTRCIHTPASVRRRIKSPTTPATDGSHSGRSIRPVAMPLERNSARPRKRADPSQIRADACGAVQENYMPHTTPEPLNLGVRDGGIAG